jgi:hypothetical protein
MLSDYRTRIRAACLVAAFIANPVLVLAESADPLDGIWISDGYGTLLEIKGGQIKASQITSISCIPDWTAKRRENTSEMAEAEFAMSPGRNKILVLPGSSADHKFFHFKGAASSVGVRRIGQKPAVCEKKTDDTPMTNFDIFWTTFDEHYPFFAMHGVNWREVRDKYRPQITDKTTSQELFDIFKAMVEPLHDAHISVRGASPGQRFHSLRADTHEVDDKTTRKIKEIIETNYVHGKLKLRCNDQVSFGVLPDSIGYLRITAFAGYAPGFDFDAHVRALEKALDEAFQDCDKLRGLIIDVRINHGGSDVLGVNVASRLASKEHLAFAKKARNDPGDPNKFTPVQEWPARVTTRPHFYGNVVELTSGNTVSAGETFTMALMGRTPPVTRVGENTQGVFSDVLGRKLPNGFRFGLPNEIFLTKDGIAFDGPGIPPDVKIPVFPKEDLEKGRDSAMEKALEILKGK